MSQQVQEVQHDSQSSTLVNQTQQLLQGPLKHVGAAGLAAVAVVQAEPRSCSSGGNVCGIVWSDTNNNGIREAGEPVIAGEATAATDAGAEDDEVVAQIKDLLETRVRPAVANDGGDITFRGFKEGIVYLHMKGACSGCPSSTATLRHGIQNLLKHYVPEVVEVRPV